MPPEQLEQWRRWLEHNKSDAAAQAAYSSYAAFLNAENRPAPDFETFLVGWSMGRADFASMF